MSKLNNNIDRTKIFIKKTITHTTKKKKFEGKKTLPKKVILHLLSTVSNWYFKFISIFSVWNLNNKMAYWHVWGVSIFRSSGFGGFYLKNFITNRKSPKKSGTFCNKQLRCNSQGVKNAQGAGSMGEDKIIVCYWRTKSPMDSPVSKEHLIPTDPNKRSLHRRT